MRYTFLSALIAVLPASAPVICAAERVPGWPSTVQGYGLTVDAAKKHALTESARLVGACVRRLDPPLLDWQVKEEFVEKNLLEGDGSPGPDVKIGDLDHGKTWILRLKPPDVELFTLLNRQAIGSRQREERQELGRERLRIAGCVFAGLTALLGLTMAYFHLTERKKS